MTFTLTEEHIKLITAAYIRWEDCEAGAPAIDCKRPYGNSDVAGDVIEILGWPDFDEDDTMYYDQRDSAMQVHYETQQALQIILSLRTFEPGTYESNRYGTEWRRIDGVSS